MICGNCGFNNNDTDAFCSNCGTALADQQPVQESASQSCADAPAQPYNQQPAYQQQPVYQQPTYQAPVYQQTYQQQSYQNMYAPVKNDEISETVSTKEWVIALLLLFIPVVSLVLPFVWAFSSSEKKSKSNFFKAYLIISLISIVLCIVMFVLMFAVILGTADAAESFDTFSELFIR